MQQTITAKDREKAEVCLKKCPICTGARKNQKGFQFWFVKNIEGGICPNCKAYAKVYGRKAHEPLGKSA
jgi:hypothetical protein